MTGRESGQSKPERVDYADAGRAMRCAVAKANRHRLTYIQHRVFTAVLVLTASYSKLEDSTCVAQVADLAGLEPDARGEYRSVRRALARLDELEVIEWKPAKGRGKRSTLRLLATTTSQEASRDGQEANVKQDTLLVRFSGTAEDMENRTNGTDKTGHATCPPTEKVRTEKLLAKASLVKEKAGRQVLSAASPARSRAKARCAADAALPAEGFELEDEQEQSFWVGGETPTVPAHPDSVSSADRQSAATTVAELERDDDGDRQVGGDGGNLEPTVGAGHGDVPNRDSGPAPVPPKLQAALPARLNADIVRLAAKHFETTPLAVLDVASRATTADNPARYFSTALRGSIRSDELADRQAQLQHEATDQEPREPRKAITGARWVRGETGATYVRDPLGTDQPPPGYGWPYPKPTPEEILEARNASKPTPRTP